MRCLLIKADGSDFQSSVGDMRSRAELRGYVKLMWPDVVRAVPLAAPGWEAEDIPSSPDETLRLIDATVQEMDGHVATDAH